MRWRRDGTWDQLLADVQTKSDAVSEVEWEVSVDDTVSCGLTRARGGRTHKAEPQRREKGLGHSLEEALGRSRGGFSTKVHLACDGKGRPLSVVLTPG